MNKDIEKLPSYSQKSSSEASWEWDIVNGEVFRNERFRELTGFAEERTTISWWFEQIHEDDRERVQNSIAEILENKQDCWEEEYNIKCADGNYKFVQDRGVVVYENGWAVKMLGSLKDITELKALRKQLQQQKLSHQREIAESIIDAQEKERLNLANELHDNVNQILTTARLYIDMMKPESQEEIDMREKARDLLMLAYDEIRKLTKELASARAKGTSLTTAIQELVHDIEGSGLYKIDFQYDPAIWVSQNLKLTIFRIAQEQLKNTMHYSQAKNISIELRAKESTIMLKITDDGIGFDPQRIKRGIGLSNIYERVQLYGGTVDVDTAVGRGCRTTVIIPV